MGPARSPRESRLDFLIENGQSDGILLAQCQEREASEQGGRVVEFIERTSPVRHALGGVEQQRAPEAGVLFVLLDVEFVLAAPYLPIDMPQVIARDILSVLNEFYRLAEVGAAMHTRHKALNDIAGPQFHRRNASNGFRMQVFFGIGHRVAIRLERSEC